MTAPAYVWQVVLNNGGGRPGYRHEVTEAALVVTRPLLDLVEPQAVEGLGVVQAQHVRCGVSLTISDKIGPRAVIAVAGHGRASAGLWRSLHRAVPDATLATDLETPPQAPWCGLVLSDRMRQEPPEVAREIIVQARVLGWAWMERDT